MVSHGGDLSGGAEIMFRNMLLALREKRPDLDMVTVYPWAGPLAADAAGLGVRTRSTRTPWWVTFEHSTAIDMLMRVVPLLAGVVQAVPLPATTSPATGGQ